MSYGKILDLEKKEVRMEIGKRVEELIQKEGYKTYKEFAEKAKLSQEDVSRIVNGGRLITLKQIKKIAPVLHTSIEYIITGKSSECNPTEKETFQQILKKYIDSSYGKKTGGLTSLSTKLGSELGAMGIPKTIDPSTLSKIVRGERQPTIKHIYWLSWFFKCSMDSMLGSDKDSEFEKTN